MRDAPEAGSRVSIDGEMVMFAPEGADESMELAEREGEVVRYRDSYNDELPCPGGAAVAGCSRPYRTGGPVACWSKGCSLLERGF